MMTRFFTTLLTLVVLVVTTQAQTTHKFTYCPDDLVLNLKEGEAGTIVEFPTPIFQSDCSENSTISQTAGAISGSFFPVGVHEITFTAANSLCGDVACTFMITVQNTAIETDLELTLIPMTEEFALFEESNFNLTLTNTSGIEATNVIVQWDIDKMKIVQVGEVPATSSQGQFGVFTKIWEVGTLAAGETATLDFELFPLEAGASFFAQVTQLDQADMDSTPSNAKCCLASEDDEAIFQVLASSELTVDCPEGFVKAEETPVAAAGDDDFGTAVIQVPTVMTSCENQDVTIELLTEENVSTNAAGELIVIGFTTHEIEFAITDACGTTAICSYTIEITRPALFYKFTYCPSDITVSVPEGSTGVPIFYPTPLFESNCPFDSEIMRAADSPASGSIFPVGVTTISFGATSECDEAACSFNIIVQEIPGPTVDLELALEVRNPNISVFESGSFQFSLTNNGSITATNVALQLNTAAGFLVQVGESETMASKGRFGVYTSVWTVGEVEVGETVTLDIELFPLQENAGIFMQVITCNEADADSTPSNGQCCMALEDDEVVYLVEEGGMNNRPVLAQKSRSQSLMIAPNPTASVINITSSEQLVAWSLIAIDGKPVMRSSQETEYTIDVRDLPNGVYFLQLTTENQTLIEQVLIAR